MTTPSICRYCGGPLIYSGRQDSCVPGYATRVWTCERCSRPETRLQHGTGTLSCMRGEVVSNAVQKERP